MLSSHMKGILRRNHGHCPDTLTCKWLTYFRCTVHATLQERTRTNFHP
uniref:Uncharacterized protein n=1 Tax=Anguilla anguilla TaxID=7936 RepID=A0A0E9TSE0_ANGAN